MRDSRKDRRVSEAGAQDGPAPWLPSEGAGTRRHAPATLRNRAPIAAVLADLLPPRGTVLEIASGSGEHCAFFADRFPLLSWQPSDPDPAALASIAAWCRDLPNIRPALSIDAAAPWPAGSADAIFCANMIHIAPWKATRGLFAGAARWLGAGAPLILYGPFVRDDAATASSNLAFDQSLRARDPAWGLRDVAAVDAVVAENGFQRTALIGMPANNLMLVYRR